MSVVSEDWKLNLSFMPPLLATVSINSFPAKQKLSWHMKVFQSLGKCNNRPRFHCFYVWCWLLWWKVVCCLVGLHWWKVHALLKSLPNANFRGPNKCLFVLAVVTSDNCRTLVETDFFFDFICSLFL